MSDRIHVDGAKTENLGMAAPTLPAHLLLTFCCVAEHKSVAHAATVLCLPYTVVSQQIARLERLIGLPVFNHSPGRVHLTDLGRDILITTQPKIVEIQDQGRASLERAIDAGPPEVTTSLPDLQIELDLWGMAAALKPYLNVLRDLSCNLNFVTKSARFARMPDVTCHLGDAPLDGYDSTLLFGEEIVAVAGAKYPVPEGGFTDTLLHEEPMLRLGHPDHERDWGTYLGLGPEESLPGIEKEPYSSFSNYMRALKAGRGVGVGLLALMQPELDAGNLVLASSKKLWRKRGCYLGVRQDCEHKAVAEDFADVLRTIFQPVSIH